MMNQEFRKVSSRCGLRKFRMHGLCQIQTFSTVFLIQLQPFSSAEKPMYKGKGSDVRLGSVVQQTERCLWCHRGNSSAKDRTLWLSKCRGN